MNKEKNPFKNFSLSEINKIERSFYLIQIGNDFYSHDGDFIFSASEAEKYYEMLLQNILNTIDNGNNKQRAAAMKCLIRLHILPLKYH